MRQLDALKSPRFAQLSTFARLPYATDLSGVEAFFLGIPFDDATTYRPGARFGPSAIRQGSRLLRPYNHFVGAYPFDNLHACDCGDIDVIPGYTVDTLKIIEKYLVARARGAVPFIAGGDHSVTLGVLRSMKRLHGRVNLVHLDSHFDFWDNHWGKKYTHGTWLRRAREERLLDDVVQIGIRGSFFSDDDPRIAKRLSVNSYTTLDAKNNLGKIQSAIKKLKGKTYVSLDIDVVDPAFAPGTGTPEVGGLSSLEVIEAIRGMDVDLAGFDVVEVSPAYDAAEITSMLAANLIYEMMSKLSRKLKTKERKK